MFLWSTAAQVALRMETMRKAETGLVSLARRFGENGSSTTSYRMELFDTKIPASVLPFKETCSVSSSSFWNLLGYGSNDVEEEELTMHAIRVTKEDKRSSSFPKQPNTEDQVPLVIVHGYMNGALYFYRNLATLANYFDSVVSVDLLGWGLSSRPSFDRLKDDSVETAEAFFVESLESWRASNNIEKMNLAGHSMGGYLSVAYTEKYPERVDQLLLLSPAGVPDDPPEQVAARRARFINSTPRRIAYSTFQTLWASGYTPGSLLRLIPESQGRRLVEGYVRNRLPVIQDPEEQHILSEYMYTGNILPGSGEYGLSRLLLPGAIAKQPGLHRIPNLRVKKVSFLYGAFDWMDVNGGLSVQAACAQKNLLGESVPQVSVYQVPKAGHLLMLENPNAFNAAVAIAAGRRHPSTIIDPSDLPIVPTPKGLHSTPVEKIQVATN